MTSILEEGAVKPNPCPFCGEARLVRVEQYQFPPDDEGPAWKWGYHVICDASGISGTHRGCGCASAWGETAGEAIAAWNRRSPSTDIPAPLPGSGETVPAGKWHDIEYLMAIIDAAIEGGFDPDEDGPVLDEIRAEVDAGLHRLPFYANPAETQAVDEVGK